MVYKELTLSLSEKTTLSFDKYLKLFNEFQLLSKLGYQLNTEIRSLSLSVRAIEAMTMIYIDTDIGNESLFSNNHHSINRLRFESTSIVIPTNV